MHLETTTTNDAACTDGGGGRELALTIGIFGEQRRGGASSLLRLLSRLPTAPTRGLPRGEYHE